MAGLRRVVKTVVSIVLVMTALNIKPYALAPLTMSNTF